MRVPDDERDGVESDSNGRIERSNRYVQVGFSDARGVFVESEVAELDSGVPQRRGESRDEWVGNGPAIQPRIGERLPVFEERLVNAWLGRGLIHQLILADARGVSGSGRQRSMGRGGRGIGWLQHPA